MDNKDTQVQGFGSSPLEIVVNSDAHIIRLHGDLVGTNEAKRDLSYGLMKAKHAAKPSWFIDSDDVRLDESGVEAWSEYVHLLLMDSELIYHPSQLANILCFDAGLVYKHGKSRFEGV
jgi:hypothetical protein